MNPDGYPDGVRRPSLDWEGLVPRSRQFQDVYYNRVRGDQESRCLYLEGNRLAERLAKARQFVVAETGFGTGLNFLLCRELWRRVAPKGAQLDFVSAELHPMGVADLRRALSAFPTVQALSEEMCALWPPPEPGYRRLCFDRGRCRLTLLFGEAGEMLEELDARVDAWFLDGFAPARNPEMWRQSLIRRIAMLSAEGATFATFTAAGDVRRALRSVGFCVSKRPGFGAKRETLYGRIAAPDQGQSRHPWFAIPAPAIVGPVAVIGAGIAGCAVADALARRGRDVLVFERHEMPAAGASGNPAGVVMPLVSSIRGLPQRWYSAAFRFALQRYEGVGPPVGWHPTGVIHCAPGAGDLERVEKIVRREIWPESVARRIDAVEASTLAGVPVEWSGVHFPEAGWIDPRLLCRSHLSHERVESSFGCSVAALEPIREGWALLTAGGRELARVSAVVISTGSALGQFQHAAALPTTSVRGQVTLARSLSGRVELRAVLGGMGYIIPEVQGGYLVGATYDPEDGGPDARATDDRRNLEGLQELCPALRRAMDDTNLDGRVGIRCTTPDTLPCIGPAPHEERYRVAYSRLDLGRRPGSYPEAPYHENLFVSGGHGSRALVSAPLAAEILASQICGTPLPVERRLMHAVHPARFLVRELSRS